MKKIAVFLLVALTVCACGVRIQSVEAVTRPETGLVLPPAAIQFLDTQEAYSALAPSSEAAPTTAVVYVGADGNAVDASGGTLDTLDGFVSKLNGNILPAFYVQDAAGADALNAYAQSSGITDGYVISDNPELITAVRNTSWRLRGILDSRDSQADLAQETALGELRAQVYSCGANIVLLANKALTKQSVTWLQNHIVTVFAQTDGSVREIFNAVSMGVYGVAAPDPSAVYETYRRFEGSAIQRSPVVAGHRGDPSMGENTVSSAQNAVALGADAIEFDIRLTKDGKAVVMHDETLTRTTDCTDTRKVNEMTLSEIQQYTVVRSSEKVPSLEDFFRAFRGTDTILVVELKSGEAELVACLKQLMDEYKIENNVVILTAYMSSAAEVRRILPQMPLMLLVSLDDTGMRYSAQYNSGISPQFFQYAASSEDAYRFMVRGIMVWSWTYTSKDTFDKAYLIGHMGLTCDLTGLGAAYRAEILPYDGYYVGVDAGNALSLSARILDATGTECGVTEDFIVLESTAELIRTDSGWYGSGDGYAYISFYTDNSNPGFRTYSAPVGVAIGNGQLPGEMPVTPPSAKGCGTVDFTSLGGLLLGGAILIAAAWAASNGKHARTA